MKILVPDHYSKEHIEKIKAVSKDIEVVGLGVQKQFQGFHALLYKFLPLTLYRKFAPFLHKQKPVYKVTIDEKDLNGPLNDVYILLSSWIINSDILANLLPFLPNLRWIHSTVTGVNHLLCPDILNNNIQITSSKGVHSVAVAEFVLALMLAFSKRIPEHIHLQQKKKWQVLKAGELADKTVGIVGFGNIGREIAKKARIMGMKVVAIRRNSVESNNVDILLSAEGLQELLIVSDFVVISAPLTKETSGIIGEVELRTMKKTAYLINISREEIVQKEALMRALKQKWIAGACIDVFHQQPLLQNSPYYSLPNLIITHHSAYFTPDANKKIFDFFLTNLKRFITGDELLGKVDKKSGY
jgi:phosphoglycerate dehydrogenase-like enzyme